VSVSLIHRLRRLEFAYRRRLQILDEKLWSVDSMDQVFPNLHRELLGPLGLMLTPLETLSATLTTAAQRQEVEICRRNAVRVVRLADEAVGQVWLDAAAPAPPPREIDVVEHVRELLSELESLAQRKRLLLLLAEAPATLRLRLPAAVLDQALLAMVAHAFNHAKSGGEVRVALAARDGGVEVTVRDNGIGLTGEDLRELFAPLQEANPRNEMRRRTALNLAVARLRCERVGGRVTATSELGHGTALTTWLPAHSS
jgi:signal transduction histidine kinase